MNSQAHVARYDYILVGGGLQSALLLMALGVHRPNARVCLLEREAELGGRHTWSFHGSDIPGAALAFVEPLIEHTWPAYEVRFPRLRRLVQGNYHSLNSAHLRRVVLGEAAARPGFDIRCNCPVEHVGQNEVTCAGGDRLTAGTVIDSRGPEALRGLPICGYQKFVGLRVRLGSAASWRWPILMDATIPQVDGYRFFYLLPYSPDEVLIEDTYYSDTPGLDEEAITGGILAYADAMGLEISEVIEVEHGSLPLPARAASPQREGPLRGGYAGAWFHPTTGYSLPAAARLAACIAMAPTGSEGTAMLRALSKRHQTQARYCAFLNRMLFEAYPPSERWNVLERFHRMPEDTIARFYSLEMTWMDRFRILSGRPPRGLSFRYALKGQAAT